jgi:hypothetical protein
MVDLDFWIFWKIEDKGLNNEGCKDLNQKLSTKKQKKFKICTPIWIEYKGKWIKKLEVEHEFQSWRKLGCRSKSVWNDK